MSKKKVLLLFGGQSDEHKVSVRSAQSVYESLDRQKYEVNTIGITKEGRWLWGVLPEEWLKEDNSEGARGREVCLSLNPAQAGFIPLQGADLPEGRMVEIVFPVLHGPKGEDGTLQGLLEMAGLPYVGSGVLGSSLGMDKDRMKAVFREAGIPVGPYLVFLASQLKNGEEKVIAAIEEDLGYPCFVKPAGLGSSVGVAKASDRRELIAGMYDAIQFDKKVVVEKGLTVREIEVSVLGNEEPQASVPGEIVPAKGFYDYEAKYVSNDSELIIPAPLSERLVKRLQDYAVRGFKAVSAQGLGRVDFFVLEGEEVLINEINTMPGFTSISMYPKLWEASGLSYSELLDRLIALGSEGSV